MECSRPTQFIQCNVKYTYSFVFCISCMQPTRNSFTRLHWYHWKSVSRWVSFEGFKDMRQPLQSYEDLVRHDELVSWPTEKKLSTFLDTCWIIHRFWKCWFLFQTTAKNTETRMWANAQRDGRSAKYRCRPLFNAAKFGWRPLLECRAVTLPRCESHWNWKECPKLANRSQLLVACQLSHVSTVGKKTC